MSPNIMSTEHLISEGASLDTVLACACALTQRLTYGYDDVPDYATSLMSTMASPLCSTVRVNERPIIVREAA
jgi:hypothetical protein